MIELVVGTCIFGIFIGILLAIIAARPGSRDKPVDLGGPDYGMSSTMEGNEGCSTNGCCKCSPVKDEDERVDNPGMSEQKV